MLVLGGGDEGPAPAPEERDGDDPLTPREQEIARLVATGATNRAIARELIVSDQTVKFHVHNILTKLGFDTRSEIAAWYARRHAGDATQSG